MPKQSVIKASLIGFLITMNSVFAGPIDGFWELVTVESNDHPAPTLHIEDKTGQILYTFTYLGKSCKVEEKWQLTYKSENSLGITTTNVTAEAGCPLKIGLIPGATYDEVTISYSLSENQSTLTFEFKDSIQTFRKKQKATQVQETTPQSQP